MAGGCSAVIARHDTVLREGFVVLEHRRTGGLLDLNSDFRDRERGSGAAREWFAAASVAVGRGETGNGIRGGKSTVAYSCWGENRTSGEAPAIQINFGKSVS